MNVDSLTDFERRVTFCEHDVKETESDLNNIGAVNKDLVTGGFPDHLLINIAGTTVWTEFVNEIEKVLTKKHAADGSVGDWQPRSESSTKTSLRRIFGHMARECRKNTE